MKDYAGPVETLIEEFRKLPGIADTQALSFGDRAGIGTFLIHDDFE